MGPGPVQRKRCNVIKHFAKYHNPACDGCGRMLAAEKSDEAAEAAMKANGWERREGKDLCPMCLLRAKDGAEEGEKT